MKGIVRKIIFAVLIAVVIIIGTSFFDYNVKNQNVLISQFGEIVDVKTEPGIFFKIPFVQKCTKLYTGERLYDSPASDVITSDKKSMIANSYITWRITDPKKYYQTISSEAVAQSRLDVVTYNAIKNVISATDQETLINGNIDLGDIILSKISTEQYGIEVLDIEVKQLDLPEDNKNSVYSRMISERQAIAAQYKADGERNAQNLRSATDAKVRQLVSEAEVIAANTEAEGEKEYFQILAEAYEASNERYEFYNFIVGLDAMKESLRNGGTITIDQDSPLYDILNNQQDNNGVTITPEVPVAPESSAIAE